MATATVDKWGKTNAVRIPKFLCDEIDLHTDDVVFLNVIDNKIIIEKTPKDYTIQELKKSWDGQRYIEDEINWGKPVGNEMR